MVTQLSGYAKLQDIATNQPEFLNEPEDIQRQVVIKYYPGLEKETPDIQNQVFKRDMTKLKTEFKMPAMPQMDRLSDGLPTSNINTSNLGNIPKKQAYGYLKQDEYLTNAVNAANQVMSAEPRTSPNYFDRLKESYTTPQALTGLAASYAELPMMGAQVLDAVNPINQYANLLNVQSPVNDLMQQVVSRGAGVIAGQGFNTTPQQYNEAVQMGREGSPTGALLGDVGIIDLIGTEALLGARAIQPMLKGLVKEAPIGMNAFNPSLSERSKPAKIAARNMRAEQAKQRRLARMKAPEDALQNIENIVNRRLKVSESAKSAEQRFNERVAKAKQDKIIKEGIEEQGRKAQEAKKAKPIKGKVEKIILPNKEPAKSGLILPEKPKANPKAKIQVVKKAAQKAPPEPPRVSKARPIVTEPVRKPDIKLKRAKGIDETIASFNKRIALYGDIIKTKTAELAKEGLTPQQKRSARNKVASSQRRKAELIAQRDEFVKANKPKKTPKGASRGSMANPESRGYIDSVAKAMLKKPKEVIDFLESQKDGDILPTSHYYARAYHLLELDEDIAPIYKQAVQKDDTHNNFKTKITEDIYNLEKSLGKKSQSLRELIEKPELQQGLKPSEQKAVKEATTFIQEAREKIIEALVSKRYLKPITEWEQGKGTMVYAPAIDAEGNIVKGEFIKEVFAKSSDKPDVETVDRAFMAYLKENWGVKNYYPRKYKGKYPIIAMLNDGSQRTIGFANSKLQMSRTVDRLYKANPKLKKNVQKVELYTDREYNNPDRVLVKLHDLRKIDGTLKEAEELTTDNVKDIMKIFTPERPTKQIRNPGFAEKRRSKNFDERLIGAELDQLRTLNDYLVNVDKFYNDVVFTQKANKQISQAIRNGKQSTKPELMKFAKDYVDAQTRSFYLDDQLFEAVSKKLGYQVDFRGIAQGILQNARAYEYLTKLGGKITAIPIQYSLYFINTAPKIGSTATILGMYKSLESITNKKMAKILHDSNVLNSSVLHSIEADYSRGLSFMKKADLFKSRIQNKDVRSIGMIPDFFASAWQSAFAFGDDASRISSFWGKFYHDMNKLGVTDIDKLSDAQIKQLSTDAKYFTDRRMFRYGVTDAPEIFRSSTGKTALQFKQFLAFQTGLYKDELFNASKGIAEVLDAIAEKDMKQAKEGAKKIPPFIMGAIVFPTIIFGLDGIPFLKDVANIQQAYTGDNPVTDAKENSQLFRQGVFGYADMPISSSGQFNLNQFIALDERGNIKTEWLFPVAGSVSNIIKTSIDLANAKTNDKSFNDILFKFLDKELSAISYKEGELKVLRGPTSAMADAGFKKFELSKTKSTLIKRYVEAKMAGNKERADQLKQSALERALSVDEKAFNKSVKDRAGRFKSELKKSYDEAEKAGDISKAMQIKAKLAKYNKVFPRKNRGSSFFSSGGLGGGL